MGDLPDIAISVRQPWAYAICHLGKDIENRSWPTRYRGPVLIHAGKAWSDEDFEDCQDVMRQAGVVQREPITKGALREMCGGIVGVATITDCVEHSASPWFFGRYGFVLADARPLPFVPLRGALGFFRVPRDVLLELANQPSQRVEDQGLSGEAGRLPASPSPRDRPSDGAPSGSPPASPAPPALRGPRQP